MTDADFLRDILADPDADEPRLRYAEWLDQRGDPRGEFIRVQVELARLESEGGEPAGRGRLADELLSRHVEEWAAGVSGVVRSFSFRRGLLEHAEVEAESFLEHADALFAAAPLRRLTLVNP